MRLLLACLLLVAYRLTAATQPNVIVMLADDAGWGDYSFNGNRQLATPHIDALAKGGAHFDRFFVQPVCSPTRSEFLTGRYHRRLGVYGVSTGQDRAQRPPPAHGAHLPKPASAPQLYYG